MPSASMHTHLVIQEAVSNQHPVFRTRFNGLIPVAIDFGCFLPADAEDQDSVFSDPPVANSSDSSEQYDRCLCSEIDRFVTGLRPGLRAVYDLVVRSEYTQSEAAAVLGVSQQRVAKLKTEVLSEIKHFVGDVH